MSPWRVSVGLTVAGTGVAVWALLWELQYLLPYWPVVMAEHGWYVGAYGGAAVLSLGVGVYVAARAVTLGTVGRKVGVVERSIRRGASEETELAEALARDEAGDYGS